MKTTRRAARGRGPCARDIMSGQVICVPLTMTLATLAATLQANHVTGVGVVNDGGELIGAVSETDIVERDAQPRVPALVIRPEPERGRAYEDLGGAEAQEVLDGFAPAVDRGTVADVFTPYIVSANVDAPVVDLAAQMVRHRVHRLFILDGPRLAGVVSSMDVMRAISREEIASLPAGSDRNRRPRRPNAATSLKNRATSCRL